MTRIKNVFYIYGMQARPPSSRGRSSQSESCPPKSGRRSGASSAVGGRGPAPLGQRSSYGPSSSQLSSGDHLRKPPINRCASSRPMATSTASKSSTPNTVKSRTLDPVTLRRQTSRSLGHRTKWSPWTPNAVKSSASTSTAKKESPTVDQPPMLRVPSVASQLGAASASSKTPLSRQKSSPAS